MKRFAANRVCWVPTQQMFRNQVVEVDEPSHCVRSLFGLEEEIRQTEWKGGIILVCPSCPYRNNGESFKSFLERIYEDFGTSTNSPLYAYHITAFDVNSMEFTQESRIIAL